MTNVYVYGDGKAPRGGGGGLALVLVVVAVIVLGVWMWTSRTRVTASSSDAVLNAYDANNRGDGIGEDSRHSRSVHSVGGIDGDRRDLNEIRVRSMKEEARLDRELKTARGSLRSLTAEVRSLAAAVRANPSDLARTEELARKERFRRAAAHRVTKLEAALAELAGNGRAFAEDAELLNDRALDSRLSSTSARASEDFEHSERIMLDSAAALSEQDAKGEWHEETRKSATAQDFGRRQRDGDIVREVLMREEAKGKNIPSPITNN